MTVVNVLLVLAVACACWAAVSAVLLAQAVDRLGVRTPFPFLGLFIFRNLRLYSGITRRTRGWIGTLVPTWSRSTPRWYSWSPRYSSASDELNGPGSSAPGTDQAPDAPRTPSTKHEAPSTDTVLASSESAVLDERPVLQIRHRLRSSSAVFITIGPYHATGSSIGLPDTSRKRMPSSPACTTTSSPRSNRTSDRFPALARRDRTGAPPSSSVRTAPRLATRRGTCPIRRTRRRRRGACDPTGSALAAARRHRDVEVARIGGDAVDRTASLPRTRPHTTRTRVPSSSVTSGMSRRGDVLVARRGHLERGRQVRPELEAVHAAAARRPAASPGA